MSLIFIPGEMQDESAGWWRLHAIVNDECFRGSNTEPLLVVAESPGGQRDKWVLKPASRLGSVGSLCELVGHRFARMVGLPVLDFDIVLVTEHSLANAPERVRPQLARSLGPNFATRYTPGLIDLRVADQVPEDLRQVAIEIYGWDVLVDNADRRIDKSNLLGSDQALYAIDHEFVFSWLRAIGSPDPSWVVDILYRLANDHFLCRHANRWGLPLVGLEAKLASLPSEVLRSITQDVPSPWRLGEGQQALDSISSYLADVQSRGAAILAQVGL